MLCSQCGLLTASENHGSLASSCGNSGEEKHLQQNIRECIIPPGMLYCEVAQALVNVGSRDCSLTDKMTVNSFLGFHWLLVMCELSRLSMNQ